MAVTTGTDRLESTSPATGETIGFVGTTTPDAVATVAGVLDHVSPSADRLTTTPAPLVAPDASSSSTSGGSRPPAPNW